MKSPDKSSTSRSLRELILAANDIEEKVVHVPEWHADVLVRALTGAERARFIAGCSDGKGGIDPVRGYPAILTLTARDPESTDLIFEDADRDALMSKSGKALDRVADMALTLSGLAPEATKAAEKNSSGPSAGSTSS